MNKTADRADASTDATKQGASEERVELIGRDAFSASSVLPANDISQAKAEVMLSNFNNRIILKTTP